MIYFLFLMGSFIVFGLANMIVTVADVYFSGPNTGYTLLNEYLPAAKVLLFLMLQAVLLIMLKFHKNKVKLVIALVVTACFALLTWFL